MRDFNLVIPADCLASNTPEENRVALDVMAKVLKADTCASSEVDLEALKRGEVRSRNPMGHSAQFVS